MLAEVALVGEDLIAPVMEVFVEEGLIAPVVESEYEIYFYGESFPGVVG